MSGHTAGFLSTESKARTALQYVSVIDSEGKGLTGSDDTFYQLKLFRIQFA